MDNSVFATLNAINVNDHTERKGKLTYLSWAWAWAEVKKAYPGATYTVYERPDGVIYWTDGRTCWVKTGVTIEGQEHIEYLPVMDAYNKSIPVDKVTSFDVNKTIQRSLTKACARHGLGLYVYAGEDLPEDCNEANPPPAPKAAKTAEPKAAPMQTPVYKCHDCGAEITPENTSVSANGKHVSVDRHTSRTIERWGVLLCGNCVADRVHVEKLQAEKVGASA